MVSQNRSTDGENGVKRPGSIYELTGADSQDIQIQRASTSMQKTSGTNSIREKSEEERRAKEESKLVRSAVLSMQLFALQQDILNLEDLLTRYWDQMGDLQQQYAQVQAAIQLSDETITMLESHKAQGHDRLSRLTAYYGDGKVFEGGHGNLYDNLRNHIVTDQDGHMVYMDEDYKMYRMDTDPQSGLPTRHYYEKHGEVSQFLRQGFEGDPPKFFANETPLSRDPLNNPIVNQAGASGDQFIYFDANLPDGTKAGAPQNYKFSISKITENDAIRICKDELCKSIKIAEDINEKIEVLQERIDSANKELKEKKEAYQELRANSDDLSEEQLQELDTRDKEIKRLEAENQEMQELLSMRQDRGVKGASSDFNKAAQEGASAGIAAKAVTDADTDESLAAPGMAPDEMQALLTNSQADITARIADMAHYGMAVKMSELKEMAAEYGIQGDYYITELVDYLKQNKLEITDDTAPDLKKDFKKYTGISYVASLETDRLSSKNAFAAAANPSQASQAPAPAVAPAPSMGPTV